jgi:hypothetical protein
LKQSLLSEKRSKSTGYTKTPRRIPSFLEKKQKHWFDSNSLFRRISSFLEKKQKHWLHDNPQKDLFFSRKEAKARQLLVEKISRNEAKGPVLRNGRLDFDSRERTFDKKSLAERPLLVLFGKRTKPITPSEPRRASPFGSFREKNNTYEIK